MSCARTTKAQLRVEFQRTVESVDVVRAYDEGTHELDDPSLFERAEVAGRVVFTNDFDFLNLAVGRQRGGVWFPGVVWVHQTRLPLGQVIDDLEILAKAGDPEDFENQVIYLPI